MARWVIFERVFEEITLEDEETGFTLTDTRWTGQQKKVCEVDTDEDAKFLIENLALAKQASNTWKHAIGYKGYAIGERGLAAMRTWDFACYAAPHGAS